MEENNKSVEICRTALKMAISSRDEEKKLMQDYRKIGIKTAAVNVGGAMREAMSQIEAIINGLSVGGKIGLAREGEHLAVAIFLSVGILQFNEVITSVAHRSVSILDNEK